MEKGFVEPSLKSGKSKNTTAILKFTLCLFVLGAVATLGVFYVQLLKTVYELQVKLEVSEAEKVEIIKRVGHVENKTNNLNQQIAKAFTGVEVRFVTLPSKIKLI